MGTFTVAPPVLDEFKLHGRPVLRTSVR